MIVLEEKLSERAFDLLQSCPKIVCTRYIEDKNGKRKLILEVDAEKEIMIILGE